MSTGANFLRRLLGTTAYAKLRESSAGMTAYNLLGPKSNRESRLWTRTYYTPFGRAQRETIFLGIARFAHINRPIEGYYMEFGSHEGNTMRLAWKHFRHLFDWDYVAFDSFRGLPEMAADESSEIFKAGNLATSADRFRKIMEKVGMPADQLTLVEGFYQNTLTDALAARLLPKKAAVVYVDCDLYSSTKYVLRFVKQFLQPGTVIVFDDWFCYHGDPNKGEQRAWVEFVQENPEMRCVEFVRTSEAQSFIVSDPGPA